MPCRDYESDDYASRIQTGTAMLLKRQADRLARIACTAMKAYEAGQDFESLIEDPEISAWWEEHKKADCRGTKGSRTRQGSC